MAELEKVIERLGVEAAASAAGAEVNVAVAANGHRVIGDV